jgi:hypothetical protein
MKITKWFVLTAAFASTVLFYACSKDKSNSDAGTTQLKVRMTDAPTIADSVNVDIRQVRVNFSNDSTTNWVDLNTVAGVYNLLGLQNGVDTLLASGNVTTGTVQQIRLVLGTNNSIVVAGTRYPLTIPSGAESGLKIMVNRRLNANLDSLLIDFDANLSIHQTGTGTYMLRPVLVLR